MHPPDDQNIAEESTDALGFSESFDDLYRLTSPIVYALCLRILQNADDAADAVQQTYVNAWKARERFRGDSKATTWLLTIARREASRISRRRTRRASSELPDDLMGSEPRDPERIALEEAKHALPFKMRSAVALYYVNDYSTRETAKIMGVAEGTVKAHLHAARRKLRRFLS